MHIRTILSTTAIADLFSGSALADNHSAVTADSSTTATTEGAAAETAASTGSAADTPTPEPTGMTDAMIDVDIWEIAVETLTGARVCDQNDKRIGEISSIFVDTDGGTGKAVVDVAGFLGIGEKPVALPFDDLAIKTGTDGVYSVHVAMTEAELETMSTQEG